MDQRLIDTFGRRISYVRLSVTDRCDLRCRYCMAEQMSFRPHDELLSFGEIEALVDLLIARGVTKLRLTGGEPLVRRGILELVAKLGTRVGSGLEELTLTTNGSQLAGAAERLLASGVRRVNVSLDSLDPERFSHITRRGRLDQVLAGIAAAKAAGLKLKINMVALKGINEDEIASMLRWCGAQGFARRSRGGSHLILPAAPPRETRAGGELHPDSIIGPNWRSSALLRRQRAGRSGGLDHADER